MKQNMRERFIEVPRTARYFTMGTDAAHEVWFVCHGYGQSASRFLRYFAILDDGSRLVVAPEGLSRFYIEDSGGEHTAADKVGASWMTREDREHEIRDYVRYLDAVHDEVAGKMDRKKARIIVLGFSQGVATAMRWAALGRARPHHLVLWGGTAPKEVDLARTPLRDVSMSVVAGHDDDFATAERVRELSERLGAAGSDFDVIQFDGGHHLNQHVLRDLAQKIRDKRK